MTSSMVDFCRRCFASEAASMWGEYCPHCGAPTYLLPRWAVVAIMEAREREALDSLRDAVSRLPGGAR